MSFLDIWTDEVPSNHEPRMYDVLGTRNKWQWIKKKTETVRYALLDVHGNGVTRMSESVTRMLFERGKNPNAQYTPRRVCVLPIMYGGGTHYKRILKLGPCFCK